MFPPLNGDQQAHAQRVLLMLQAAIAQAGGWLSFADYMQLALYAPGLGYYSAGATKLGAAGDFVTAPEISPLFAPLVARSFADVLSVTGGSVLELGAGTGRLAGGALQSLAEARCLPHSYDILEVSADLRERQRLTLGQLAGGAATRVGWLERLPGSFRGVIFANEVLDALATERFIMRGAAPLRLGVVSRQGRLQWQEQRGGAQADQQAIAQRLGALADALPDGYVGECCLGVEPWIAALAATLQQGVILLIDYGLPRAQLYHAQRAAGTLRCFFSHRAHDDPFFQPGLCDIGAWVDFTAVAEAAVRNGLQVLGFTTQAAFLLENGIEALLARPLPAAEHARLAHGARQLLLPGEMGESVKVLALGRDYDDPLSGFSLQDLTSRF